MNAYVIGRCRPPRHTQFKPGQSGNPRGRPRKSPRADVPGQILEDVRAVANMEVVIKTPSGALKVPAGLALVYGMLKGAIEGKSTALKMYVKLLTAAYEENLKKDPILCLLDDGVLHSLKIPGDTKEGHEQLRALAKRSRTSPRLR